jgi:FkbM family methyltransferase
MTSHGVFDKFGHYDGWAEPGFERWFYGVNVRDWLLTGQSKGLHDRREVHIEHPPVNEEYFEWIALLAAILAARGRFCMAELGAGWGRWMVTAAVLCRQRGLPVRLIGVEAEPSHFDWMKMALRDNDVDPAEHDLWYGAVTDRDTDNVMLTGPEPPETVWGHRTIRPDERRDWESLPGYRIRLVPGYSLKTLFAKHDYIDLVDMDVQGTELDIVSAAFETLNAKVGVVHIGTHPPASVDKGLTKVFRANRWVNAYSYPPHAEADTAFGRVAFVDGVQTWVNPARADVLALLGEQPNGRMSRLLPRWPADWVSRLWRPKSGR